ncbi:unnamed protein product [Rotaria sp. Silwood2]|nr:unnamed protein product [Rotaria sp. Silwood2]CAF2979029.1 unnamed protein product [Rotaria sp. Silwood2]CAF3901690.1 unnamed protein product [Rotaria sp. Silwood2]CAF3948629.1 unnamed protein product [Rotaria sp. Silwood2]CAF4149102.1 unnamed protein product [Rotaria sp. Silwood2]
MGHKQSTASNLTFDDFAFGTAPNAVQIEDVIEATQQIPGKLFGAKMIENDPSMHKMQQDLLSFDDTLRRIFRRKKHKRSKKEDTSNESYQDEQYYEYDQGYYDQDGQYYTDSQEYFDQKQEPIPEEDEDHLSSNYAGDKKQTINEDTEKDLSWRCRYCTAENKSTDVDCRQCKQRGTNF